MRSSSSTAERSCSLSIRVIERDDIVELLVDPKLDPVLWVDLGGDPSVSVGVDQLESIVA